MSHSDWKKIFLDTPAFDQCSSFATLQKLSKNPPDLTQSGTINPQRIDQMKVDGAGFTLLYGFQKVSESILDSLVSLAQERKALEQMTCMQQGEAINWIEGFASENRKVLHTATRDIFGSKPLSESERLAREESLKEHEKLQKFIAKYDSKFSELIFIGIGGSELGPRAMYQALEFHKKPGKKVHFIGNVDPDDVACALRDADLAKACVVIISKSGTTLETATNEEFVRSAYLKKGLKPEEHFISVTMPNTPMDDRKKYLECFYLWDYVGGRYSSTSMVGGVLLAFAYGYDVFREMLRGAHDMDQVALKKDVKENLPLLLALLGIWNRNFLGYPTLAVIPYTRLLGRFPAHLQQCDMESNGKRVDRNGNPVSYSTGPVVWGEPGTNAQHSFFQLIHQGTDIIPVDFIGFAASQAGVDFEWHKTVSQEKLLSNMFAQAVALACGKTSDNPNKEFPGNRPSSLLIADKLTPYALGSLLALYEHKIDFQGFIWGINSFDQEGVQLGKLLADKMISQYVLKREGKEPDFDLSKIFFAITK